MEEVLLMKWADWTALPDIADDADFAKLVESFRVADDASAKVQMTEFGITLTHEVSPIQAEFLKQWEERRQQNIAKEYRRQLAEVGSTWDAARAKASADTADMTELLERQ